MNNIKFFDMNKMRDLLFIKTKLKGYIRNRMLKTDFLHCC